MSLCTLGECFREVHIDGQVVRKANVGLKVMNEHEKYIRNENLSNNIRMAVYFKCADSNINIWGWT